MVIQNIEIDYDGYVNGDSGEVAITANPWTVRAEFEAVGTGENLIGFYDTLAHAIAGVAAASTASQFGASCTPATIATWMGTTSPQTGFVAVRTNLVGQTIQDENVA